VVAFVDGFSFDRLLRGEVKVTVHEQGHEWTNGAHWWIRAFVVAFVDGFSFDRLLRGVVRVTVHEQGHEGTNGAGACIRGCIRGRFVIRPFAARGGEGHRPRI